MTEQMLDAMDLERERGITIKAHAVTLAYKAKDGEDYVLNLIDHARARGLQLRGQPVARGVRRAPCSSWTPSQGVEAQTLANTYLAVDHHLEVDPGPEQDRPSRRRARAVKEQIENIIGIDTEHTISASAKGRHRNRRRSSRPIVALVPPPDGEATTRR
jgi:GTP-binding protein LepA